MSATNGPSFSALVSDATVQQIEEAAVVLGCNSWELLLAALGPGADDEGVGREAQTLGQLT